MRAKGFSLLELLLVIVVIAGILLIGLRRYWIYQEEVNYYGISSDETELMLALDRHFESVGCFRNGIYASTDLEPKISDLGDPNLKDGMSRPPVVDAYHVKIENTSQMMGGKPIYELLVMADMNKHFSTKKIVALANLFNARYENNHLIWKNFPGQGLAEEGNEIWILQASANEFRREQNKLSETEDINLKNISASNCVVG